MTSGNTTSVPASGPGFPGAAQQAFPIKPGSTGRSRWPRLAIFPDRVGARQVFDSSNNLFVFGGWGYASNVASSTGYLNDVWEYQQSSGQWIWWKGSSNVNQPGSFPSQYPPSYDVPYVQNTPGSRFGSAYWKQGALDYFHIFGGEGFDVASTPGYLSDLLDFLPFP